MYQRWKERYENGWATVNQLERLVALDVLTQAEFDQIVTH